MHVAFLHIQPPSITGLSNTVPKNFNGTFTVHLAHSAIVINRSLAIECTLCARHRQKQCIEVTGQIPEAGRCVHPPNSRRWDIHELR
jgi:NAD-dependent dihydropyrimidine dehydrogenase PreA subunit